MGEHLVRRQGEVGAQDGTRRLQRLSVAYGVRNEEDESRDPRVVAQLLVGMPHGGVNGAEPADGFECGPAIWRHRNRIPRPQVAVTRKDDLGPPRGGRRQQGAGSLKDWELRLVVNSLASREDPEPQIQPQRRSDGPENLERWRTDLVTFNASVVRGSDPGRGGDGCLAQAELDAPLSVLLAQFGPGAAGRTVAPLLSGLSSCHRCSMTRPTYLGLILWPARQRLGPAPSHARLNEDFIL